MVRRFWEVTFWLWGAWCDLRQLITINWSYEAFVTALAWLTFCLLDLWEGREALPVSHNCWLTENVPWRWKSLLACTSEQFWPDFTFMTINVAPRNMFINTALYMSINSAPVCLGTKRLHVMPVTPALLLRPSLPVFPFIFLLSHPSLSLYILWISVK